jgi:hypothetical protein
MAVARSEIRVFREADGTCPFMQWLAMLEVQQPSAYSKCLHLILALSEHGHDLRRPMSDTLRDGIRELRAKAGRVNYRILYSFHGSHIAVLLHGATKKAKVEKRDIDLAVARLKLIQQDAARFTTEFEE